MAITLGRMATDHAITDDLDTLNANAEILETADAANEKSVNKVTEFQETPDDTHYPSEKLVKDQLDGKVDKVTGKALSTNDFTDPLKTKLDGIEAGAEANDLSEAQAAALIGGGSTVLHKHDGMYYTEDEMDSALALKDDKSNKVTSFQATPDDTHYPSEKLVYDNLQEVIARSAKRYGIKITIADGTVTRIQDAVGLTIGSPDGSNAIASDFDDLWPWKGIEQWKVSKSDGKFLGRLGDDIYDTISDSDCEYVTMIPQFWYRDEIVNGYRYMEVSDMPIDGFWPACTDGEGKPVPYRLIGRVPLSWDGSELRSLPDEGVEVNRTYTSFITELLAKGDGNWSGYDLIWNHHLAMLGAIEAGSLNFRDSYGEGINSSMPYGSGSEFECVSAQTGANSIIIASTTSGFYEGMVVQIGTAYSNNSIAADRKITDITDNGDGTQTITVDGAAFDTSLGNTIVTWGQPVPAAQIDALSGGSGYISQFGGEAESHVSYRGIWDLWGNVWQWTYGFARYDGMYYTCIDPAKYNVTDPRTDDGWIATGEGGYIDNGYQKEREPYKTPIGVVDWPTVAGGGAASSTFYAAYLYYFNSTYSGVRILLSGGHWVVGSNVSPGCWNGYSAPSSSFLSIGGRLIR